MDDNELHLSHSTFKNAIVLPQIRHAASKNSQTSLDELLENCADCITIDDLNVLPNNNGVPKIDSQAIKKLYELGNLNLAGNVGVAYKQRKRTPLQPVKLKDKVTNDFELVSSLTARLSKTEIELAKARKEIERLNFELSKGNVHCSNSRDDEDFHILLAELSLVKQENVQLKGLLKRQPEYLKSSAHSDRFPIDLTLLKTNIEQLNALVDKESYYSVSVNESGAKTAKFKEPDVLDIFMFSDGFALQSNLLSNLEQAVRLYTAERSQMFIKDIMDGYFPADLREQFPEGVEIALHDLHTIHSSDKSSANAASSQLVGQRLWIPDESLNGKNSSFVSKLVPVKISKSGQIVNVQQAVAEFIDPQAHTVERKGKWLKLVNRFNGHRQTFVDLNAEILNVELAILKIKQALHSPASQLYLWVFESQNLCKPKSLKQALQQFISGNLSKLFLYYEFFTECMVTDKLKLQT